MKKIVTLRKKQKCAICDRELKVGDKVIFNSFRTAKYSDDTDDDTQIGIQYIRYYECTICGCLTQD